MALRLRPVTRDQARAFIASHHRHAAPPVGWRFGTGVELDGVLVGVAMASNPRAIALNDGWTLEVSRTCTDGTRHANSKLYGAIARAARALGFRRLYTYTLEAESGSSLRAVGFVCEGPAGDPRGWDHHQRGHMPRVRVNLFGEESYPDEPKLRWRLDL